MNLKLPAVLVLATLSLTACFGGPPSNDTVRALIEQNGQEAALAQANLFRTKPMTDEDKANLPNAFRDIEVSDCREDEAVESEYLCFVKMNVKSPLGPVVAVEEDVRIRKSQEGEWRLVSNK